jgi:hypothetical protein
MRGAAPFAPSRQAARQSESSGCWTQKAAREDSAGLRRLLIDTHATTPTTSATIEMTIAIQVVELDDVDCVLEGAAARADAMPACPFVVVVEACAG